MVTDCIGTMDLNASYLRK